MIRINLMRTIGGVAAAPGTVVSGQALPGELQRRAVLKLLVILLFPVLLYVYDMITLSVLQGEVDKIRGQIQSVDNRIGAYGDTGPRVEKFQNEKKRLEKQLESLRNLTKNRLREVKTLATLQNIMPERAWLKSIRIDNGYVILGGYSATDEAFTDLIRALESNVFFSGISVKSTEQESTSNGSVKKFEIDFRAGKTE